MFNDFLTARRGGSLRASADQTALVSFQSLPGQTDSNVFEALFVALDALMFVYFLSYCFDVVVLSSVGTSGGRFWAPKPTLRPSIIMVYQRNINIFEKKDTVFVPKIVLKAFWGSFGPLLGTIGGI